MSKSKELNNDPNDDNEVTVEGLDYVIERFLGNSPGNVPTVILIGSLVASHRVDIAGRIVGTNNYGNHRDDVIIDLAAKTNATGEKSIAMTFQGTHKQYDVELIECDYNGQSHKAIRLYGTGANYYPHGWFFSGQVSTTGVAEQYPVLLEETDVSNIVSNNNISASRKLFFIGQTEFLGNINAKGTIQGSTPTKTIAGSPYTLQLENSDYFLRKPNDGNIVVPTNASVPFSIGTTIALTHGIGATNVSILGDAGVNIVSYDDKNTLAGPYATAALLKVATDTWYLSGNLV